MEFKLILAQNEPESIVATVRERTELIDEIESMVKSAENDMFLTGYTEDDIEKLSIFDVECIFVEDGKTYAVYQDGKKYRLRRRLYEVEENLPKEFVRINKSAVANWKRIRRFKTEFSGAVDVEFKCGYEDYVSRRCFADLKRRFKL